MGAVLMYQERNSCLFSLELLQFVLVWLRSSVVEQETHKLLVGSSNLPVATIENTRLSSGFFYAGVDENRLVRRSEAEKAKPLSTRSHH